MIKLFAIAFAAFVTLGFTGSEAQAGGHGCYVAAYGGCARVYHDGCARAWRPCKRMRMPAFFRKSPPCVAPCYAPVYVERPEPVIVDIQPVRPAYYPRPCGVWRGCGRW